MNFENVRAAIRDIADGKMVILVDDEDRENEGDLCMAADLITPESINFMALYGRGLICLTVTEEKTRALGLRMMVERNTSAFETGFTVSIEAKEGVSTGISAADRARTIRTAVAPDARPEDLVTPGHVFPIRARDGGVLVRTGQTEGSVDLARMAGLQPTGVICEIMNDDGTMARRPDLEAFAERHGLRIVTIAEMIAYRSTHETLVEIKAEREVSLEGWGQVRAVVLSSRVDGQEHLAFVKGTVRPDVPTLVRVQSVELPADLVSLSLTGGGAELRGAMAAMAEAEAGVFVYLCRQGGTSSMAERLSGLEEEGPPSTYDKVGGRLDLREFGTGAQILRCLGVRRFRLITNRDFRIVGLEGFGLELIDRVSYQPQGIAP